MTDSRALEYRAAIQAVIICSQMFMTYDIPALLQSIERADAIGPIVDPTLYREKAQAMHEDKEALEAALPLWRLGKKLQARIEGRPTS